MSHTTLNYIVPPECAGQIVEYSYAMSEDGDDIYCRIFDYSDKTIAYHKTTIYNLIGNFEPCNFIPKFASANLWHNV